MSPCPAILPGPRLGFPDPALPHFSVIRYSSVICWPMSLFSAPSYYNTHYIVCLLLVCGSLPADLHGQGPILLIVLSLPSTVPGRERLLSERFLTELGSLSMAFVVPLPKDWRLSLL